MSGTVPGIVPGIVPGSVPGIVIVGGGHAAGGIVTALRQRGYPGQVTLVSDEPHLPYQRPPLSKAFLAGDLDEERLFLRPAAFYAEAGIVLHLGVRAERIDRQAALLHLSDGKAVPYGRLVLAMGARVRRLAVPGSHLDGVFYLRSLEDARRLRPALGAGRRRLVVIGGGYVGLELAAVATKGGLQVTVLEAGGRLLGRVASPHVASCVARAHREAGVDVRTGAVVTALEGEGSVTSVLCGDGSRVPADLVAVGIGVLPNAEMAAEAGLDVQVGGIVVDEAGRTSDPAILAAGDCAAFRDQRRGTLVRLESVQNAADQGRAVVAALCGDPPGPAPVPWFWSDQYGIKLQMAGLADGYDDAVVRPGPRPDAFSEFYLEGGRVVAMAAVNQPQDFMLARRALAAGPLPIAPAALADPARPLRPQLDAAVQAASTDTAAA